MQGLRELFGPSGALARSLRGFVPRSGQQRMAERVAEALQLREVLLIEAGTGTGKTFAYLVPALLSGRRVLISTGTRTLQDQLFARDLPLLAAALGRPVRTALLKGRANYLCRSRLESGMAQGDLLKEAGGAIVAGFGAAGFFCWVNSLGARRRAHSRASSLAGIPASGSEISAATSSTA